MAYLNNCRHLGSARRLTALMLLSGLLLGGTPSAYAQVLRQDSVTPVFTQESTPEPIQDVSLDEIRVQLETNGTAIEKLSDDFQAKDAAVQKLLTELETDAKVCPINQSEPTSTRAVRTTDMAETSLLADQDEDKKILEEVIKEIEEIIKDIEEQQKIANVLIKGSDILQKDATNTLDLVNRSNLPEADKTKLQKKVKEAQDKFKEGKEKAEAAKKDLDTAKAKYEEAIEKLKEAVKDPCNRLKLLKEARKLIDEAGKSFEDAVKKLREAKNALTDGYKKLDEVKKAIEEKKVP